MTIKQKKISQKVVIQKVRIRIEMLKKTQEDLKYFFKEPYNKEESPFLNVKVVAVECLLIHRLYCLVRKLFQNEIQVLILFLLIDPNTNILEM